jgi:hypothetical protein
MVATNKSSSQITNFKLAVSAAKYVTTDLGNATGTNLAPLGQSEIRQVNPIIILGHHDSKHNARREGSSLEDQGEVRHGGHSLRADSHDQPDPCGLLILVYR